MAQYRRYLTKIEQKNLHFRYDDHVESNGGIFTPDKRKKLLGVKPKHKKNHEDTSDFWYDVRTYTKNGLKDLGLLAEVAHPDQLKDIFEIKIEDEIFEKMKKTDDENLKHLTEKTNPTLNNILRFILNSQSEKIVKEPWTEKKLEEQPDAWKYFLVREIIRECFTFLQTNRYITSKTHDRLVEEVLDMIDSEAKNMDIPIYWRRNFGFA